VRLEASEFVLQLSYLSIEIVHLIDGRRALARSGMAQSANVVQNLVSRATADFVGGRE
jgi:hypothetical protein